MNKFFKEIIDLIKKWPVKQLEKGPINVTVFLFIGGIILAIVFGSAIYLFFLPNPGILNIEKNFWPTDNQAAFNPGTYDHEIARFDIEAINKTIDIRQITFIFKAQPGINPMSLSKMVSNIKLYLGNERDDNYGYGYGYYNWLYQVGSSVNRLSVRTVYGGSTLASGEASFYFYPQIRINQDPRDNYYFLLRSDIPFDAPVGSFYVEIETSDKVDAVEANTGDQAVVIVNNGNINWLSVESSFSPADLNNDGRVDSIDLAILRNHWGRIISSADLNQDGIVDTKDLGIMMSEFAP